MNNAETQLTERQESCVSSITGFSNLLRQQREEGYPRFTAADVRLCGRNAEIRILEDVLARTTKSFKKSENGGDAASLELVVVSGNSGTGKSALVEKTLRRRSQDSNHIWVSVKFDQLDGTKLPFLAITGALSDLCDVILQEGGVMLQRVCQELHKEFVDDDLLVLVRSIPSFSFLIGMSPGHHEPKSRKQQPVDQVEVRFQLLFRSFLQLCARFYTVVLFMDDCQWADDGSLGVIQKMLCDARSRNTILVCAHRNKHPTMLNLDEEGCKHPITRIQLDSLSPEGVTDLLNELLMPCHNEALFLFTDYETRLCDLSQVVYSKTRGTVYFVLQFLDSLVVDDLLWYNEQDNCWEWDIEGTRADTNVSENVADIVTSKIQRLVPEVQSLLQMAACLGFSFSSDLLRTLYGQLNHSVASQPVLDGLISTAISEGLLEDGKDARHLKFSHDRVQQSLFELLGPLKSKMHLDIGKALLVSNSKNPREDRMCFFIADQLNLGADNLENEQTSWEIVDFCLASAKRAKSRSAIAKSAEHLKAALRIAGQLASVAELWRSSYDFCLDLHNELAEVAFSLGQFELSNDAVEGVLQHSKSERDEQRVRAVRVSMLGAEGRFQDAIDLAIQSLRLQGLSFPIRPNKMQVALLFLRAARALGRYSHRDIVSLPVMTDERKKVEVDHLLSIVCYATYAELEETFAFASLQTLLITLRYGMTVAGCQALASYAMMLVVLGMTKRAFNLGMVVLDVLRNPKFADHPQSTNFIYGFVYHLQKPIRDAFVPLHRGYRSGLQKGDVEFALTGGMSASLVKYICGDPLIEVEEYLRQLCAKVREFRIVSTSIITEPLWQIVLNLMGESEDPVKLTGEAMHEDQALSHARKVKNEMVVYAIQYHRFCLSCYFEVALVGEHVQREMQRKPKSHRGLKCHFMTVLLDFFEGLFWWERFRHTRRSRYRCRARARTALIERRVSNGAILYEPFWRLLQAEQHVSQLRHNKASHTSTLCLAYDGAIVCAAYHGLGYVEAIASEKAGNSLIARDRQSSREYYRRAIRLYESWGALALVAQVAQKLEQLENVERIEACHQDDPQRPQQSRFPVPTSIFSPCIIVRCSAG